MDSSNRTAFAKFASRRSVVHSTKGIVTSTQPLASECGLSILRKGGNCADAAVAIAAGLNVTEPGSTGIGGDMFCLFYEAATKCVHSLNGSGRSGEQADLSRIRAELGYSEGQQAKIGVDSVHAVTVPGAAAGWVDCVSRFGSQNVCMAEILAPAIELAERGFPVSDISAYNWQRSEALLLNASPSGKEMLKKDAAAPNGYRAPSDGEVIKNPTLAQTFRELAAHGKRGFYTGRVAEEIVKVVQDVGGHLTLGDLEHHMDNSWEDRTEPISLKFAPWAEQVSDEHDTSRDAEMDGVELWEIPPNGQGLVALIALGILQALERDGRIGKWTAQDHNSPEYLHAVIEALRIAFADANWWVADPEKVNVSTKELISAKYLAERATLFSADKACDSLSHGSPAHNHSDTVYFAVTDDQGNGISFINSNFSEFGTGIVPEKCGFTLHNRGANFRLDSAYHPNNLAPRKRPYHTIIPGLVTNVRDQTLHSVMGVMGGFMQPQGQVQILLNQVIFGFTPQAALDAPRICISAGGAGEEDRGTNVVFVEEGITDDAMRELARLGHEVKLVTGRDRGVFGRGQIINRRTDSVERVLVWSAGSDPRGDGAAVPQ